MGSAWLIMLILYISCPFVKCEVHYIVPEESFPCPPGLQECLTLENFISTIHHVRIETDLTLLFLQGEHNLYSELIVVNSSELILYSTTNNTQINCDNLELFTFANISNVQIRNLKFVGCGENFLQEINLTIYNTVFQGDHDSGVAFILFYTTANITNSSFISNTGTYQFPLDDYILQGDEYKEVGGAIAAYRSKLWITECNFNGNSAEVGGALFIEESIIFIRNSTFEKNFAEPHENDEPDITGGVMVAYYECFVSIEHSIFFSNSGSIKLQGVLFSYRSLILVENSSFVNSTGSVFHIEESNLTDYNSIYEHNTGSVGAVSFAIWKSNLTYISSQFSNNCASSRGGVFYAVDHSSLILKHCDLSHNMAISGGAVNVEFCTINIEECLFHSHAASKGSAILAEASGITINETVFHDNSAKWSGIIYFASCNVSFISTAIINNSANSENQMTRGIIYAADSMIHSSQGLLILENFLELDANIVYLERSTCDFNGRFIFSNNSGSLLAINSWIAFYGYTRFQFCSYLYDFVTFENGGAITIIESTIYFNKKTEITANYARGKGGAIHATGSTVHMIGKTIIANNTADESGGGLYLFQSKLNCALKCIFLGNTALKSGGAIYAIASTLYADEKLIGIGTHLHLNWQIPIPTTDYPSTNISEFKSKTTMIIFTSNNAQFGGAIAFEMNSKFYGSSFYKYVFKYNSAEYGGAVYVNDYTNSGTCASRSYLAYSASSECFIQTVNYNNFKRIHVDEYRYEFLDNYAKKSGPSLYGGLLDRCTISQITGLKSKHLEDVNVTVIVTPRATRYTEDDTQNLMISSDPVRICFCRDIMNPDCGYQWPDISVMKGHPFTVTLVAVDQVNHSVNATIRSFLSSPRGGLGKGQQSQSSYQICTNLTFNAFSPLPSEKLTLYAEGPCNNTGISKRNVFIYFTACICPIGFQPIDSSNSNCDCTCDPRLYPQFITSCNSTTELLTREDTSWIGYHREINHSGYIIYRYCPYDYCFPPTHAVKINFNVDNGADAQCNLNRSGILCGTCRSGLSLSLGSTRCIMCSKQWPGLLIIMILAGIMSGIVLIAILQVLHLSVAVGTLSGIVFYANIIAANFSTFIPVTHPNVLTVFISWLNLDLGIDVCFINGMDTFAKQWLQLVFPTYVIVLVAMVIFISERYTRLAKLIGRGNPIATLATLILLSYTKYLQVIIDIFSFAILKYPDDSVRVVWLPDATVRYLSGKHVLLFLVAVVIIILGIVYTSLLFAWQWLQLLPRKRIFEWIWYTRVNSFMDAYLAPYTPKHRYWTGLLLIARIVLYLVSALNLSNNPQINLLAIGLTISCFFVLKAVLLVQIYKKWPTEIVEFSFHLNLLFLTFCSFYSLGDNERQIAIAYTSISISLALFCGIMLYHIISTMLSTIWLKSLINKVTQRKVDVLGDAQTALLLGDYGDNNMELAAVAPTSTIVEISPEHSTQDSSNIDMIPHNSLDMQIPTETETPRGN